MNYPTLSLHLRKTTLTVALIGAIASGIPARAQTTFTRPNSNAASLDSIVFVAPDLSGKGRPGDRSGGASRGGCQANVNPQELVALVPDTKTNPSVGLTVDAHPTFWFNVPYAADKLHALEFVLLDEQERTVYQTQLAEIAPLPGIVSFRLPETTTPLAVGETYKWLIKVYCEEPQLDDPETPLIFMGSSIIRVAPTPDLEDELKVARTERERAFIYARRGIWYNALTEIGNLRRTGSATADWENLLGKIDLDGIAAKPLVDCCSARGEQ